MAPRIFYSSLLYTESIGSDSESRNTFSHFGDPPLELNPIYAHSNMQHAACEPVAMRVFAGGINTETNTFSPIPTGMDDYIISRKGNPDAPCECQILHRLKVLTEERNWTFCPAFIAFAEPGGITTKSTYESLRNTLLADLKKQLPVDMVLLPLHGAMVAEDYDDCEGDLITRVREIVGTNTPIGVELDLHCHLTQTMMDQADIITLYKEYPHTDIIKRAEELFDLTADMATGKTRPTMAMRDCRMINLFPTALQPMRSIVDDLKGIEKREGILSADIAHGFPWGDVADCGTKSLVISDNNPQLAKSTALEISKTLTQHRDKLLYHPLSLDDALDQALNTAHTGRPIVIADQSDNPGGGAPGDSTFALAALLERKATQCAVGMIWDPMVASIARKAGEGANITIRLGGKAAASSGEPVDLTVTVRGIIENFTQPFPQDHSEPIPIPCGDTACLEHNSIFIIVNTIRTQVFHPTVFTAFDLDLGNLKTIVVKSIFHFYAGFKPIAEDILIMAAPGPLNARFTEIPYKKADTFKFPWIDINET